MSTTDRRYCSYCDAYRRQYRCEACEWPTYSLVSPAVSALPPAWRPGPPPQVKEGGN